VKTTLLLLILSFLALADGCTKPVPPGPQLPPITHEGKNTFGCKINGKIYITSGKPTMFNGSGTEYLYYVDSTFWIHGEVLNPKYDVQINFKYRFPENYNRLTDSIHGNRGHVETTFSTSNNYLYDTDSFRTGYVNILYNAANILSGTFAFDAINSTGDVMHITEGRFDISK
jgi:hypothetical protein